jgi:hypothetical protein
LSPIPRNARSTADTTNRKERTPLLWIANLRAHLSCSKKKGETSAYSR